MAMSYAFERNCDGAAKAVLDKGTNPEQAPFFPYLAGDVAFYTGAFETAAAELQGELRTRMSAGSEDPASR